MRVVSLNLDAEDAGVVRRLLAAAVTYCACADGADGRACATCDAAKTIVSGIDQVLNRPSPRRLSPLPIRDDHPWPDPGYDRPPLPLPPASHDIRLEASSSGSVTGPEAGHRHLRLVSEGVLDPRS